MLVFATVTPLYPTRRQVLFDAPPEESRVTPLGVDHEGKEYIFFPHFVSDFRLYWSRRKPKRCAASCSSAFHVSDCCLLPAA